MLLLNANGKSYAGSPTAPLHLTVNALEGQSQGHCDFEVLYLANEPS